MAEEKEKAEGAEQPKKSKTVIIIVAVVLVLVLVVGGALAFLMLKGGEEGADGAQGADSHAAKPAADKKKAAGAHGANDLTVGPMFAVDGLIINLMSEGGARYAKLAVALELDAQELAPEMLAKKAMVTDIIITVFSTKTAEELMNIKGKEGAKNEIMEKVNERLKDGRVKNVYFTNFVVQ